jgi:hypothetical protein
MKKSLDLQNYFMAKDEMEAVALLEYRTIRK